MPARVAVAEPLAGLPACSDLLPIMGATNSDLLDGFTAKAWNIKTASHHICFEHSKLS